MSDDKRDGKSKDEALGGTVMMDEAVDPLDAEFDGTMMLDDDAPAVAADGTVLIGAGDNPAAGGVRASPSSIDGRKSSPPPLPGEDTSVPPIIEPTPAPPKASDLTLDRSEVDGETTDGSPKPAASSSFFKPAVPVPEPAEAATKIEGKPAPKPEKKPAPKADKKPAPKADKKPSGATTASPTAAKTKQAAAEPGAAPQGAPKPPPRAKKIPMWAQLLGLVVVAGLIGHFVARRQSETQAPPPPPAPKADAKPTPKAKAKPKPKPAAPAPTPSQAAPAPEPPPPAAPPAPVAAADLSACVAKEIKATFPSDKLSFVCEEQDANKAQKAMGLLFAGASGPNRDARGPWNTLSWYRMAKLQTVRTRCCGDAQPMAVAEALSSCKLAEALTAIHEADRGGSSLDEPIKTYGAAVDCLFKNQLARMFGMGASRPSNYQRDMLIKSLPAR